MPIHHIIFKGVVYEKVGESGKKHKVMEIHDTKAFEPRIHHTAKSESGSKRMEALWAKARSEGKKSIKGVKL
jgi:hypothetical protein